MKANSATIRLLNESFIRNHCDVLLKVDSSAVLAGQLEAWGIENYRKELAGKWSLSAGVLVQEVLVGYRIVSEASPLPMHVHGHRLSVDSAWRGKGIASRLINYTETLAKRMGFVGITNYIHDDNLLSQNFFRGKQYQLSDDSFVHKSLYVKRFV